VIRSIEDFRKAWSKESATTMKVFGEIKDPQINQAIAEGHRTLGRIAWHIAQTIPEMAGHTGLRINGPALNSPLPKSMETIKKGYETAASSLLEQVTKNWKDETLAVEDDMYGGKWSRGATLTAIILHEVHHRGQMTVLMRQAGLKVTGIYGPSKEEWNQFGMQAPAI